MTHPPQSSAIPPQRRGNQQAIDEPDQQTLARATAAKRTRNFTHTHQQVNAAQGMHRSRVAGVDQADVPDIRA
jgi:hypothetical protein